MRLIRRSKNGSRCSKFSLVWMGKSAAKLRKVRSKSIGTEVGYYEDSSDDKFIEILKSLRINSTLPARNRAVLRRFVNDMDEVMSETHRVLVPGGRAIFVVGENSVRGVYIRNSKIISTLAEAHGLILKQESIRKLPPNRRYLPPPRKLKGAINRRMGQEVVLEFSKPKKRAAI